AAFAGANPIVVVAGGAAEDRLREGIVLHLLDRDEARFLAIGAGGDHALLADEEAAVVARAGGRILLEGLHHRPREDTAGAFVAGLLRTLSGSAARAASGALALTLLPLRPARRRHVAEELAAGDALDGGLGLHGVVPEDLERRHGAVGREVEADGH